ADERDGHRVGTHALARDSAGGVGGGENRRSLSEEGASAILPPPTTRASGLTQAGVVPLWHRLIGPLLYWGAPMVEPRTATCPHCSQPISPEDTIVFGHGRLGHLDCRRPRFLAPKNGRFSQSTVGITQSLSALVAPGSFTCARLSRSINSVSVYTGADGVTST